MTGGSVRERMVDAGERLLAQRGYTVTMLDVMHEAGTPRGSIYYHFPQGKEQLAVEVVHKVADDIELLVAALARKKHEPVGFLQAVVDHHTKRLVSSDFQEGCPVLGITVSVDNDSSELRDAVAAGFSRWVQAIASALRSKGLSRSPSADIASTVVSAIEGAIVISRATGSAQSLKQLRRLIPALVVGAGAAV